MKLNFVFGPFEVDDISKHYKHNLFFLLQSADQHLSTFHGSVHKYIHNKFIHQKKFPDILEI